MGDGVLRLWLKAILDDKRDYSQHPIGQSHIPFSMNSRLLITLLRTYTHIHHYPIIDLESTHHRWSNTLDSLDSLLDSPSISHYITSISYHIHIIPSVYPPVPLFIRRISHHVRSMGLERSA